VAEAVVAGTDALAPWRDLADLGSTVAAYDAFATSSYVVGAVGDLADLDSTVAAYASSFVVEAVDVLADLGSTAAAFAFS
jgi:hypothetical protein